jgi:hypothetical protein
MCAPGKSSISQEILVKEADDPLFEFLRVIGVTFMMA